MINLLPPEVKQGIKFAKYNVTLVDYMFVIIAAVGVMTFLMLFGLSTLRNTESDIESVIASDRARAAELAPVGTAASALSSDIDTIGNILDSEIKFSFLLREIGSVMPRGTKLAALSLSQDTTEPVRLSVELETAELAGVLQENLAESRLFIGADILNVSQAGSNAEYPFAGDLQAYYDPAFALNTLDDAPEETTETTPQSTESTPEETTETTPPASTSQDDSADTEETSL